MLNTDFITTQKSSQFLNLKFASCKRYVQVKRIEAALTAVQAFARSMETQSRSGFVFYVPENHCLIDW